MHGNEACLGHEFRRLHFLLLELLKRPVRDCLTVRYVPPECPVEFIELHEPVGVMFEVRISCYLQVRSSNLLFKPRVRCEIEFRDIQAIIEAPPGLDKTPLCDEANSTRVCCPDLRVQFAWSERPQVMQKFLVEARTHALTLHVGVNPDVYLEFILAVSQGVVPGARRTDDSLFTEGCLLYNKHGPVELRVAHGITMREVFGSGRPFRALSGQHHGDSGVVLGYAGVTDYELHRRPFTGFIFVQNRRAYNILVCSFLCRQYSIG